MRPGMIPESLPTGMTGYEASTIPAAAILGENMRRIIELVTSAAFAAATGAAAADDLSAPNTAGDAMGHLHYVVRDVAANKAFWVELGGRSVLFNGTTEGIVFPDVVVLLRQGEPTGGTVVN